MAKTSSDFVAYNNWVFFFFFQAEDGIRDGRVTGVQTCALPISIKMAEAAHQREGALAGVTSGLTDIDKKLGGDRKSTRLNSSHPSISYAVFCLKKKKSCAGWVSACSALTPTPRCRASRAEPSSG